MQNHYPDLGSGSPHLVILCLSSITQVVHVQNCLEGNTMSNRGAYSTKERMPSDRRLSQSLSAWKAVPDWLSYTTFRDVLPSRQYKCYGLIPAHPCFTRMYGVTYSAVFQTILNMRDFGNQIVIC